MFDKIKDKLIYVAIPYGGKPENYALAERVILALTKKYPECCFVSPVLAFGHMYKDMEFYDGMELCLTLLDQCAELLIVGDESTSRGVPIERAYAERYKMEIHAMTVKEVLGVE